MPRKPQPPKSRRTGAAVNWVVTLLTWGTPPAAGTPEIVPYYVHQMHLWEKQAPAWASLGPGIMESWAAEHPGRRPWSWWRHDAPRDEELKRGWYCHRHFPIARLKVAGAGRVAREHYPGIGARFWFGVPLEWIDTDPAQPIFVEAESVYLERFGLLLPEERHRLRAADKRAVPLAEILAAVPT